MIINLKTYAIYIMKLIIFIIIIDQMKVFIVLLALIVLLTAQSAALKKCIEERCPDQYAKCLKAKGCEDKLNKCATKCGEKVDVGCWTLCLGLPGAAANVATCAVNQKCLANVSIVDTVGLNLMTAIEAYANSQ
jgi:hypothetical protein